MEKIKFTSPVGTLNWVYITGAGKENLNGEMIYTADVVVPADEAEEAVAQIDKLWDESKPKGAKKPKSLGYKTNDDGDIVFTMKTKTAFPSGDEKTIKVFDRHVKEIKLPSDVRIGNGSRGRLAGMASIYKAGAAHGVTLYLDSLQLLKLVEYKGAADAFDEEEGDDIDVGVPFNVEEVAA